MGDSVLQYKTLLFDADETLFDFARAEREAISDTLTALGVQPTDALILAYSRINDGMWKRLERGEITKAALKTERFAVYAMENELSLDAKTAADTYVQCLAKKPYLFAGVTALCEKLSKTHALYIITNGIGSVQRSRFALSGLAPYFRDLFISEEIGAEKPARAYFDAVARRIKDFSPKDTLVIGDSLSSDIKGGIAAGLATCWYNKKGIIPPADVKPDYTVSTLEALSALLCP